MLQCSAICFQIWKSVPPPYYAQPQKALISTDSKLCKATNLRFSLFVIEKYIPFRSFSAPFIAGIRLVYHVFQHFPSCTDFNILFH